MTAEAEHAQLLELIEHPYYISQRLILLPDVANII